MGLDSAFYKQTYILAYDRDDVECSIDVVVEGKKLDIDPKRLASVRETVVTMRHCWMIHDWLEKRLGHEIAGDVYIGIDDLKDLEERIGEILQNHAKAAELLPVSSDDDYDESYFEWLKDISDELNRFDLTWKPFVSYVYCEW